MLIFDVTDYPYYLRMLTALRKRICIQITWCTCIQADPSYIFRKVEEVHFTFYDLAGSHHFLRVELCAFVQKMMENLVNHQSSPYCRNLCGLSL